MVCAGLPLSVLVFLFVVIVFFFFSSRRRHTRLVSDWSSDVCSSDLVDDAMKIQTRGDRILQIGKDLTRYDAIDTGLFICPLKIFDCLERVKRDGDCSLADGVRSMASGGKARAVDIGNAWWQDIDTPAMLACAETQLRSRLACHDIATANAGSDRGNRAEN